ncbi:NUDIX domain-containing protein [Actinocorallia sp. API 0066]|uniref:NUDIX domain-containing protein n=1 Tax=Actinocorallia sp. API 0066 TaxID=2896846 RepID=UPI001E49B7E4|nr:NUDIX domain-containing protein [Actinocorallia sp. API 0066]MCD0449033.1 NUDIX domain-containing protein [Actinocorallia sp. API 0066]
MTDPYAERNEKLVRDRIPELIRATGGKPDVRVAEAAEIRRLLLAKLWEEADEFAAEPSAEELADVLEVVRALADGIGCDPVELERVRAAKAAARGGFTEGMVLRGVAGAERPTKRKARALLLDGDALVLFRRNRPGRSTYYTTPGGGVEDDDADVEAGLRRELMEELGATAGPVKPVFTFAEHRPHASYIHQFFVCRLVTMDLGLRSGPEFSDPTRGTYDVERVECLSSAFAGLPLWPRELRDFLTETAPTLPSLV